MRPKTDAPRTGLAPGGRDSRGVAGPDPARHRPARLRNGSNWALDYLAYRDAALRLAAEGSLYSSLTVSGPFHPGPTGLYLYPPPLGIAVTPLAWSSFEDGALAWYLLHLASLAAACALMPVRPSIRLASFGVAALSFAVLRDLAMGNVSVLLLLPLAAGWRWLDRPAGSVALALATSIRVTFGAFLLWFLLRRAWLSAAWMALAGLTLILLSLPFIGIDGYRDYLATLLNLSDTTGVLRNSDLASAALSIGVPMELAGWALVPGFVTAVAAILWSLRRDAEVGYMVTLSATLLRLASSLGPLSVLPRAPAASWPSAPALGTGPAAPLVPPAELLPFVVLLAVVLPFLARDVAPAGPLARSAPQAPSAEQAPAHA